MRQNAHFTVSAVEVLFGRIRLFGNSLVSKGGGLRGLSMVDGFMTDDLVEVENRKGSGMTTGILKAGSGREHCKWHQTRYFQRPIPN